MDNTINKKVNEFLNETEKSIKWTKKEFKSIQQELQSKLQEDVYIINNSVMTEYIEKIIKLTGQIEVLYQQKNTFENIFKEYKQIN